jgi:hypothetical protein
MMLVSFFCVSLFLSMSASASDEESGEGLPPKGYVRVEQSDLIPPKAPERDYKLLTFKQRRTKWGTLIGFDYSSYVPNKYYDNTAYTPDYSTSWPLLELQFTVKRNFDFGSLGVEIGGGYFDAKSADPTVSSEFQFYQVRLGATFIADMIFSEPWAAPYISGGAYLISYKETMDSATNNGTTQVAPYVSAGVQFELDWLDRKGSMDSYESSGMQATHAFLEVRKYFTSTSSNDPDFGSDPLIGGGLRLEF